MYKKKWKLLTIISAVTLSSVVVVSSCENLYSKNKMFDYSDTVKIKGEIIRVNKKFDFNKYFKTFGLIESVSDYQMLLDNIDVTSSMDNFYRLETIPEGEITKQLTIEKQKFIELFKNKFTNEFFENNSLIFYQGQFLSEPLVDSVLDKDGDKYINLIDLYELRGDLSYVRRLSSPTWIPNTDVIYLISIPKNARSSSRRLFVNEINSLGDFRRLKGYSFYMSYGIEESKKENKDFYTYHDIFKPW